MSDVTTIPVLPCVSPEDTLDFYQALGFEVTHEQKSPYVYLAVRRGGFDLHFQGIKGLDPKESFSACLVIVPEVESYHRAFADALRGKYGKVPTAGIPRITRLREGQSRFTVVDPSGNSVIYIRRDEPEMGSRKPEENEKRSGLAKAIATAAVLRDSKTDDAAAAKVLDVALAKYPSADPVIAPARSPPGPNWPWRWVTPSGPDPSVPNSSKSRCPTRIASGTGTSCRRPTNSSGPRTSGRPPELARR
jgi:hypothetical protein